MDSVFSVFNDISSNQWLTWGIFMGTSFMLLIASMGMSKPLAPVLGLGMLASFVANIYAFTGSLPLWSAYFTFGISVVLVLTNELLYVFEEKRWSRQLAERKVLEEQTI